MKYLLFALALAVASVTLIVGCGGDDSPSGSGSEKLKKPTGKITLVETVPGAEGATGPGVVHGRVTFVGKPPVNPPLNGVKNTDQCLEHGHDVPLDERVVLDASGNMRDMVVVLTKVKDAPEFSGDPIVVDQKGCLFIPRVSVAQVGQPLHVTNSDTIAHNVRLQASKNEPANVNVGPLGKPAVIPLTAAETCHLTCDLHPWMNATVMVFEHPWFTISATDGTFRIEDIPPGTYGLEAHHHVLGRVSLREIVVPEAGEVEASVVWKR